MMGNIALEDDTMKTILGTMALAALMTATAVTTVQAEGGSDRLINYRLQQEALVNRSSEDSAERFAELIKEQPTAAGSANEQQDQQQKTLSPAYKSPIVRDRELYGTPH
jgi:hypothetical protein